MKLIRSVLSAVLVAGVASANGVIQTMNTGSLIDEMVDLQRLDEFHEPYYKTVQYSSYDRSSIVPEGEGWFHNSDGFGNESTPNFQEVLRDATDEQSGEYVMCDVEGPGAIVRLWTAQLTGELRVYLDDMETPLYDGPSAARRLLSG